MTILRAVTVLEPATSYDLVTIEAVKAYFATPIVTDDPNDPRLQALITFQSKVIADYCDRVFAREKVSEVIYNTAGLIEEDATSISIPLCTLANRFAPERIARWQHGHGLGLRGRSRFWHRARRIDRRFDQCRL